MLKSAIFTLALSLQREVILYYIGLVHTRVTLGSPIHSLKDLTQGFFSPFWDNDPYPLNWEF